MRRKKKRLPGILITAAGILIAACFLGVLIYTEMIPTKYMILAGTVLVVVLAGGAFLVWDARKYVRFWIGAVLHALLAVLLIVGSFYIFQTRNTLSDISEVSMDAAQIEVYVDSDNDAISVEDLKDGTFGVLKELDRVNTDAVIQQLKEELGKDIEITEYEGLTELVDGLRSGETDAVLMNQAYMELFEDVEGYENMEEEVHSVATEIVNSVVEPEKSEDGTEQKESVRRVSTLQSGADSDTLLVYISGIDTRDKSMIARSRSDVNIVAVINTDTRQVLLINTPRDYYVPLSISGGIPDKLTHAGIYGVDVSMETLEMLYDIKFNCYFRVNFSGFVDIIDALGGIDVYSDYEFNSQNESGFYFQQGLNHMDGKTALVFCRERYSFEEGDRQRGKNQMAVISGVINKALTPSILTGYTSVLEAVKGSFETNISYNRIAKLVKEQLESGGTWKVASYSVDGTGDSQKPFSMSVPAYVMVPDQATVDKAKELIEQVKNGETIQLD